MDKFIITTGNNERIRSCEAQKNIHQLSATEYFSAADFKKLNLKHNNSSFTQGMAGCYLSHYMLWQELCRRYTEQVLILEDDFSLVHGFNEKFEIALKELPTDFDIALIGWYQSPPKREASTQIWQMLSSSHIWGLHAYIINPQRFKNKLQLFETMHNQIDLQLFDYGKQGKLKIYLLTDSIANQVGLATTVQKQKNDFFKL